jgi:NADPH2 dehydrogenase
VHSDLGVEYYRQRSSVPGTLIVTEATFIDARAGGYANAPGIYNDEQVAAWKKIVDAVHANGSYIYLQLWALGRAAIPAQLAKEGADFPYVSSGDMQLEGKDRAPRPLSETEISEYVSWYGRAAKLAVEGAGFDGVEIHGANGYLVDQFIQDVTNNRIDRYGGSILNRARFPLEVIASVVRAVGPSKTGIRLSPWERYQGMRMADPVPTFSYLIEQIAQQYPDFAYIHLTEERAAVGYEEKAVTKTESLDFARKIWKPRPMLLAGGYTPENALERAREGEQNGENLVIAFGRHFIANPDLPSRIRNNIALNPYDRDTFYLPQSPKGYTEYPFA